VLGTTLSAGLGAQDVGARLDRRVSPEVQRAVQGIAADAAARGLPVDPLVQKAIEGAAKGVRGDRVIAAVRALAGRLAEAMEAVRAGGLAAPSGAVVAPGATPTQAAAGRARAAGGPPPGRAPDWVPPGQQKPRNPHKP